MYDAIDILYGMMVGILYDQEYQDNEYHIFDKWLQENSQYCNEPLYQHIEIVLKRIIESNNINYDSYINLLLEIEKTSQSASNFNNLASRVLTGILEGVLSDGNLSQLEIINLHEWMRIHSCSDIKFFDLIETMVNNEDYNDELILKLSLQMKEYLNEIKKRKDV